MDKLIYKVRRFLSINDGRLNSNLVLGKQTQQRYNLEKHR